MAHTFTTGEVLTATLLNDNMTQRASGSGGFLIYCGTTNWTLSSAASASISINYTAAGFASLTSLVGTCSASSGTRMSVSWNGAPGNSTATAVVHVSDGSTVSATGTVNWIAIGT